MIPWFRLAVIAAACVCNTTAAQNYPSRPIRIIVQFTPGTSTDIIARIVAQKMSAKFGQQVIVDNRPGAGGVLGTEIGAKANPDGYTLTMAVSSAFGINPTLYSETALQRAERLRADHRTSALTPQTLVTSPAGPVQNGEGICRRRARKTRADQLRVARQRLDQPPDHRKCSAPPPDIRINHVPFKGSAEAHTQLIGGQIPVMFDAIPATLPHIKSGRLRGLGIATLKRSPFLPDLPTIAESGYRRIRGGRLDRHRRAREDARCRARQTQCRNGNRCSTSPM